MEVTKLRHQARRRGAQPATKGRATTPGQARALRDMDARSSKAVKPSALKPFGQKSVQTVSRLHHSKVTTQQIIRALHELSPTDRETVRSLLLGEPHGVAAVADQVIAPVFEPRPPVQPVEIEDFDSALVSFHRGVEHAAEAFSLDRIRHRLAKRAR